MLSTEMADFIESGVSIIICVVGPDGRPWPGRAIAARVSAGGIIRVVFPGEGNTALEASAGADGPLAVTFSAPLSHRTIQLKGTTTRLAMPEQDDLDAATLQSTRFSAVLSAIGYPPVFVTTYCRFAAAGLRVVTFQPQAAFEQTPGPGAGRAM